MKKTQNSVRDSLILHVVLLTVMLLSSRGLFGSVEMQKGDLGCHRIDKEHSAIYLQFEKTQAHKNKEGQEKVVYFRIRNNTNCEVLLVSPNIYFRNVNGVLTSAVEDGAEVSVYYEIETKKGRLKRYSDHRLNVISLLPGRSCIFPVHSSYLKKNSILLVPCRYEWEDVSVRGPSPRSEALFHASELPRGWDK